MAIMKNITRALRRDSRQGSSLINMMERDASSAPLFFNGQGGSVLGFILFKNICIVVKRIVNLPFEMHSTQFAYQLYLGI